MLTISTAGNFLDIRFRTTSYAPFGRLTANITDQLRVVGGLRYTHDEKTFKGNVVASAIVCAVVIAGVPTCPTAPLVPLVGAPSQFPYPFPAAGGPPAVIGPGILAARIDTPYNARQVNSRTTYHGGIEYDIAPQSMLYATVESGYRSGGFNAALGFETFNPEYLTAYTLGMKNRFLDNKLQLNVEGFIWNYTNQQISHVGLDLAGRTANFTQNIGASKIRGVEVDVRALVTPNTLLSADFQYLNARNTKFLYQQALGNAPPLTGCASRVASNPALYDVDCSGLPSYNSPSWTINLAAQQTFELGTYKVVAGFDTQYKSNRYTGIAYLPTMTTGNTWLTNLQLQFGPDSEAWSVAGYVRNVGNSHPPIFSSTHPGVSILVAGTIAPRTYGVRASAKF